MSRVAWCGVLRREVGCARFDGCVGANLVQRVCARIDAVRAAP
jgi:hypothetical protein